MATLSIDAKQALQFTIDRHITVLWKELLTLLRGLAAEHDEALGKLASALPPEYGTHLDLADWYTEEKGLRLRKAVLDRGNDCKRAILEEVDQYDVTFPSASPLRAAVTPPAPSSP